MHQPQVSRAEPDVDGRTVAQPRRQERLEEQTEVHGGVDHALGPDGQPPRLTDDQVGPLHHNDRDEERRLRVRQRLLLGHAARDILTLGEVGVPVVGALGSLVLPCELGALTAHRVVVHAGVRAATRAVHHVLHREVVVDFAALPYAREEEERERDATSLVYKNTHTIHIFVSKKSKTCYDIEMCHGFPSWLLNLRSCILYGVWVVLQGGAAAQKTTRQQSRGFPPVRTPRGDFSCPPPPDTKSQGSLTNLMRPPVCFEEP